MPAPSTARTQEFPVVAPDIGLVTGVPYHAIPDKGWSQVLNMRFRLGNAQKVPGFSLVQSTPLDSAITGLYTYQTTTGYQAWIATTLTKVYKMAATDTSFVDISGGNNIGGVTTSDLVSMANFKDQLLITNGRTNVWQATVTSGVLSNISALGGSPPMARGVTVFQGHALLWDLNPYSGTPLHQTFAWSDLGNSANWTSGGTSEAGSLQLVDEPGGIMTCIKMRDSLMVYKNTAVYLVDYTGFPFTMSERRLISGVGTVSMFGVVNVKDAHYFLATDRNMYSLTLFGPKDVAQQVRYGVFNELDWGAINATFCTLNDGDNEIYVAIPGSTASLPSVGYMLQYLESKWGRRDFGPVSGNVTCFSTPFDAPLLNGLRWQDFPSPWSANAETYNSTGGGAPIILMGDSNGYVYKYAPGNVDCGNTAMVVQADTKMHDFGDPLRNKRLSKLGLTYNAAAGTTLSVYVLTTQNAGIPPTANGPYNITLDGSGNQWLDMDLTARFFGFRFYNNMLGQTFTLTGYTPVAYAREVRGPGEEVT